MPKPQQLFWRGESIENEKFLLNLFDIKVSFRIKGIFSKTFLKKNYQYRQYSPPLFIHLNVLDK